MAVTSSCTLVLFHGLQQQLRIVSSYVQGSLTCYVFFFFKFIHSAPAHHDYFLLFHLLTCVWIFDQAQWRGCWQAQRAGNFPDVHGCSESISA